MTQVRSSQASQPYCLEWRKAAQTSFVSNKDDLRQVVLFSLLTSSHKIAFLLEFMDRFSEVPLMSPLDFVGREEAVKQSKYPRIRKD